MNYEVTVQGRFYKVMSGESTDKVLSQAIRDIEQGLVEGYNPSEPNNIVLKAV
jgi:hypothetical protein